MSILASQLTCLHSGILYVIVVQCLPSCIGQ